MPTDRQLETHHHAEDKTEIALPSLCDPALTMKQGEVSIVPHHSHPPTRGDMVSGSAWHRKCTHESSQLTVYPQRVPILEPQHGAYRDSHVLPTSTMDHLQKEHLMAQSCHVHRADCNQWGKCERWNLPSPESTLGRPPAKMVDPQEFSSALGLLADLLEHGSSRTAPPLCSRRMQEETLANRPAARHMPKVLTAIEFAEVHPIVLDEPHPTLSTSQVSALRATKRE